MQRSTVGETMAVGGPGGTKGWRGRLGVTGAVVLTALFHLMALSDRLSPDEGGFAVVARHWTAHGGWLYGPQWVDRPPGLLAVFSLADALGPLGVRVLALLVSVTLVAAVGDAVRRVAGARAAGWSAWLAFALASSWLLDAQRLDGELVAAALVAVSMALTLRALDPTRTAGAVLPLLAGASAAAAVLVKQNFVDGIVFAVVLLLAPHLGREGADTRHGRGRTVGLWLLGGLVPVLSAVGWAGGRPGGVSGLLYAAYGFRLDASAVMAASSAMASLSHFRDLALHAWSAGLLPLLVVLLVVAGGSVTRRRDPLVVALLGAGAVEMAGVLLGGSYWAHYLIGLIPSTCIGMGLLLARRPSWLRGPWLRAVLLLPVVTTLVASPVVAASLRGPSDADTTGRWIARSGDPGDSITVMFTHANVIQASGLRPAYPFSWSLPTRVRDPHLRQLRTLLRGPGAPTWVVQWDPTSSWGLDPQDRTGEVLRRHYQRLPAVCGHPVWLHHGERRRLAALPTDGACRPGSS